MRPSLSVATIISRGVELKYPIIPVLESVRDLADEIVINIDSGHPDGTWEIETYLAGWFVAGGHRGPYRLLQSQWDWTVHDSGGEFRRQTDLALKACGGDWILYLQADEVVHEEDHDLIRDLMELPEDYAGVEFTRLCFWRDGTTLRKDWTLPLIRMFRKGRGRSAGDSQNCTVDGMVWPTDEGHPFLYHYSRVGAAEDIGRRIYANDLMHHSEPELDPQRPYDFQLREVDGHLSGRDARLPRKDPDVVLERYEGSHPAPIRRWFGWA